MSEYNLTVAAECALCPGPCAAACPVLEAGGDLAAAPRSLALTAYLLEREALAPVAATAEVLYSHCIGCDLCRSHCLHEEPKSAGAVVRGARARLAARGQLPPTLLRQVTPEALGDFGPALREAYGRLRRAAAGDAAGATVILLVDAFSLKANPAGLEALIALLHRARLRVQLPPEPFATGISPYQLGLDDTAELQASRAQAALTEAAARSGSESMILCTRPGDAYALTQLYPGWELLLPEVPVFTVPRLLLQLARSRRLTLAGPSAGWPVTYQDPAYLARYLGDPTSLPELLRLRFGARVAPLPDAGRTARPVAIEGAAVGVAPDLAAALAARRWADVTAIGAQLVVTADPFSYSALRPLGRDAGVPVLDIAQVL